MTMPLVVGADLATADGARTPGRPQPRFLKPGWPLVVLFGGFPVWWALGMAQLIFFVAAAAMAVILYRREQPLRLPKGSALWLLFMVWMLAGVLMVRAQAPQTVPGTGGMGRVAGFAVWGGWYVSVTIAMLYVTNTARELPTQRVVRLLGWMFVVTASFGVLAVVTPELEFTSLMELLLPRSLTSTYFVKTLIHPSLSSSVDFLGYVQPRPTAPFPYSNDWGNNVALYLPYFMLACFGRDAGRLRKLGPVVLVASIFPIVFSLNRGLWIALALAAVYAAVRLAVNGRTKALYALVAALVVGGILFVSSPLYDTIVLRVETPHSNDRRAGTAETVVAVTGSGSPFVGFGTTRTMQGSFSSLAGGETAECHQCAPPPLGTQGFMWRLVLTTGFVGTALCLAFFAYHFLRRARGPAALDVTTCTVLLCAVLCFLFYDSLGAAMFTAMMTIGLMARSDLPAEEVAV
ncbi:hypothetical protein G5V58_17850 [Nocardioides anomalus]|uniref:O-antigen ligase family protein n=1 Tax=Nocardioides anomalus TaxID=2712223 RepID=A0A6G6WGN4_9ACTN|nr:hypothetical protein [Nocardioides anomalus]QIG44392.1 hypothetical protein G5V58_17850 [Nocardioides anomalus]